MDCQGTTAIRLLSPSFPMRQLSIKRCHNVCNGIVPTYWSFVNVTCLGAQKVFQIPITELFFMQNLPTRDELHSSPADSQILKSLKQRFKRLPTTAKPTQPIAFTLCFAYNLSNRMTELKLLSITKYGCYCPINKSVLVDLDPMFSIVREQTISRCAVHFFTTVFGVGR